MCLDMSAYQADRLIRNKRTQDIFLNMSVTICDGINLKETSGRWEMI